MRIVIATLLYALAAQFTNLPMARASESDCYTVMRGFLVEHHTVKSAFDAFDEGQCSEALKLMLPAAKRGNPYAQVNVGVFFELGMGVDRDDEVALNWYIKAANQGLPKAQFNAAVLLIMDEQGSFQPNNSEDEASRYIQAYVYLEQAAKTGLGEAITGLRRIKMHMTAKQIANAERIARTWADLEK